MTRQALSTPAGLSKSNKDFIAALFRRLHMVNAEVLLQLSVMTKPSPDGNWGYPQRATLIRRLLRLLGQKNKHFNDLREHYKRGAVNKCNSSGTFAVFPAIVARGPDADSVQRAKHSPEKENCLRDGAPWQLSR